MRQGMLDWCHNNRAGEGDQMDEFPIMSMKAGDAVTVTEEWGAHTGHVSWWDNHNGFRVNVALEDGTERVFEASGDRAARFWR